MSIPTNDCKFSVQLPLLDFHFAPVFTISTFKRISHVQQVKEEHLKFVIQCCDIESSCCSNKCIQCPDKEDIDDSDLTYSPRLMIPIGVNDYGREYGEKSAKCAICIDDFCEGDIVVGSINPLECSHIFHFG